LILVTRKVKGYIVFAKKYVTGKTKRFQTHKLNTFLINITNQVDL